MTLPLPPLFAIVDDDAAWVYSTLRDAATDTWHVSPHRIYPPDAFTPAFIIETMPSASRQNVTLTIHSPTGRPWAPMIRQTNAIWRYEPWRIFSMYDPDPIHVITLHDPYDHEVPIQLSRYTTNTIHTHPGTAEAMAFWRRRWDPAGILEDLDAFLHPPPPVIKTKTKVVTATPPAFVTALVVADAIAKADTCPITLEPITAATAAVTNCFHVFDGGAIATWLSEHKTCPVCKQVASVTPK